MKVLNGIFVRELVGIILDFAKSTDAEKLAFLLTQEDPFGLDIDGHHSLRSLKLQISRKNSLFSVAVVSPIGNCLSNCTATIEELTSDGCRVMLDKLGDK